IERVALENDPGIVDVAMTPMIGMGGAAGFDDTGDVAGLHQFVYAVADDRSIRVADISKTPPVECDTEVDPRYLRGLTDPNVLACMPVGDPATPPRRPLARSPGVQLEGKSIPTSVAIIQSQWDDDSLNPYNDPADPKPDNLIGYFAMVTAASGSTAMINI